jgi:ribosome-binding protein aMBF1 (putative translation factor)
MSRKSESLADDYIEFVKRAQEQPGIKELAQAYGRYEQLVRQSELYLSITKPKFIAWNTNSSSRIKDNANLERNSS